jgi:hypothetical protein
MKRKIKEIRKFSYESIKSSEKLQDTKDTWRIFEDICKSKTRSSQSICFQNSQKSAKYLRITP